jgi:ribosome biogenesis GTPase A
MPFKTEHAWDILWQNIKKADLILEVLDARNPNGTRSKAIEDDVRRSVEKQIILVLNKIDLIPGEAERAWTAMLNAHLPTIPISSRYPGNINDAIDRIKIVLKKNPRWDEPGSKCEVLVVGYPNSGKSSLIKALTEGRKIVGISPKAGYTKTVQRIKLTDKIYLMDTPGVIPFEKYEDEIHQALDTASITPQMINDKESVAEELIKRVGVENLCKIYNVEISDDPDFDIIEAIAKARGLLKRGGGANEAMVYELLVKDWQRNRISYYFMPDPQHPEGDGFPHLKNMPGSEDASP